MAVGKVNNNPLYKQVSKSLANALHPKYKAGKTTALGSACVCQ